MTYERFYLGNCRFTLNKHHEPVTVERWDSGQWIYEGSGNRIPWPRSTRNDPPRRTTSPQAPRNNDTGSPAPVS